MSDHPIISVFYSWQSDLPNKFNRNLIECATRKAVKSADKKHPYTFVFDKDTRKEPGSPDIKQTILKKISLCQFMVADVSLVNRQDEGRMTPNPNVLFELGYAVHRLGWERIILIYNTSYGRVEELPFDLRPHRPILYELGEIQETKPNFKDLRKNCVSHFTKTIEATIDLVLSKPGFKLIHSNDYEELSDEIKRRRDIATLTSIFQGINSVEFKHFYEESISGFITDEIFLYWYDFEATYESPAFYLYDEHASDLVDNLYKYWGESLSYGECFESASNGGFRPIPIIEREYPEKISRCFYCINKAFESFKGLCRYIRKNYLEIDITKTDAIAFQKNKKYYPKNI